MEDYGVNGSETVVFEDSKMGIQAAKQAGARVIALKDAMGISRQEEADVIIEDLQDAIDVIREWGVKR